MIWAAERIPPNMDHLLPEPHPAMSTPMTEMMLYAGVAGMVYGLQRWLKTDKPTYIALASVAALANYLPALRATRINPVEALRWK